MQPEYNKSIHKIRARAENVAAFKRITGLQSIPKGREYWTLCNNQPPEQGSEIVQLQDLGFLKKEQFHGVDRDSGIIYRNKLWHPEAHWYEGDWNEVIENAEFNPSLVYLDATSFADHEIAMNLTVGTMLLCPDETVLIVNVMANDPRSSKKFDKNKLVDRLGYKVPSMELAKWSTTVENYEYSATGITLMISYIFHKKGK